MKSINKQNNRGYYTMKDLPNREVYKIYEKFFTETDRLLMKAKYRNMRLYEEYEPN